MSIILKTPVTGPAAWKGADLAGDSSCCTRFRRR